jgi:hypothetical protein
VGKYTPVLLILCLGYCVDLIAQTKPGNPRLAGFTATSEGGVEGTQTIKYDENGKIIEANIVNPISNSRPAVSSVKPVVLNSEAPKTVSQSPTASTGMTTSDGRKVPFGLSGNGVSKQVDSSVDFNSALKNSTKMSNIGDKKFDTKMADLNSNTPYSRENIITFDSWHGKYDVYGRKKAEVEVADTFDRGELKNKNLIEVKSVERQTAELSGRLAEIKGIDTRLPNDKNSRYDVTPSSPSDRVISKTVDQLSMQDINRYQFRRNRSDAPGLPVVKPGSDEVQNKSGKQ